MTKTENLFVVAIEECAELQQAITKSMRFGLDNYNPLSHERKTNETDILTEYYQLTAVMEKMLSTGLLRNFSPEKIEEIKAKKLKKVSDYADLSVKLGRITPTR